jgi:pyruvate formate lyase activating enzyme
MDPPFICKTRSQERTDSKIHYLTCKRRCKLADGKVGWCRTQQNRGGTLYTLIYGAVSSLSCNPIEKKPLHHFYPGSVAFTAGSLSCNFDCPWCQNYHISKAEPGEGRYVPPQEFVSTAIDLGCQGTSISFNEPTLSLEWSLEVFRLARARGLYNTFVTNGYMTADALDLLVEAGLDGMNVDVKGDSRAVKAYCGADVEVVWRNCRRARSRGVWVEVTTLVIPGVNDGDDALRGIAERIGSDLGRDVPWHVSGYHPVYHFTAPPTPVKTLERAWQIGKRAGLAFVYLGNVPGHRLEDTTCPDCGTALIRRRGLRTTACHLDRGRCPGCKRKIPGVWGHQVTCEMSTHRLSIECQRIVDLWDM